MWLAVARDFAAVKFVHWLNKISIILILEQSRERSQWPLKSSHL